MGEAELLIVGASVRAAAQSAARLGVSAAAIDFFGDQDLRAAAAEVRVAGRTSKSFLQEAEEVSPRVWMYTGGLENDPQLVGAISRRHALAGNSPEVLLAVRDPLLLADALAQAGFDRLPVAASLGGAARRFPGPIMRKPRKSGGGRNIRLLDTTQPYEAKRDKADEGEFYYQAFRPGQSVSAVFAAGGGKCTLLGVTEQLVGCSWCHAPPFAYAGSIGMVRPADWMTTGLERIGELLAGRFSLSGLFNVDSIAAEERLFPLEVNPRYPASAEILERQGGANSIAMHLDVCREGKLPMAVALDHATLWGKAVLYAPRTLVIGRALAAAWLEESRQDGWPAIADVPAAELEMRRGEPIVTIFARGRSTEEVRERLQAQAGQMYARIARQAF